MLISEIANYLATELDMELGVDLFMAQLPPEPTVAVGIIDNGGIPAAMTNVEKRAIQVIVRGEDYATGWALVEEVKDALNKASDFLDDTWAAFSLADGLPVFTGGEGAFSWSMNFTMTISLSD